MKNAMKKLTSLLLVAVLLVGAIPFGAFAAEFDPTAFLGTSSEAAAAEPAPVPAYTVAPSEQSQDVYAPIPEPIVEPAPDPVPAPIPDPAPAPGRSAFCTACGNKFAPDDRFCPMCGNKRD